VLFALSPWELVLSRSFLIDTQCLFFSLLCLYVGILAVRKNSAKLSLASGAFFAAALLTKYFAAFILIPLVIFWLYSKPKKAKTIFNQMIAFALPALLSSLLWYQVVLGKNLLYMFVHRDFTDLNYSGVNPSYSFVGVFLWNYGLGVLFVVAIAFSLILLFTFRKELPKAFRFDIICLATILPILVVDMILGAGFNLKAPYNNAIKYDYFALPFFSLIAASLLGKCISLLNLAKTNLKLNKKMIFSIVFVGVILLAITIYSNFVSAHHLSAIDYLLFRVRMDQIVGYSLLNPFSINQHSFLTSLQYVGFIFVFSGLLWASKERLRDFFVSMKFCWFRTKTKKSKNFT